MVVLILDRIDKMSFFEKIQFVFLQDERWKFLLTGLKNTALITLGALVLGMILGFVIGAIRSTYDRTKTKKGVFGIVITVLNAICKLYLTVIRGTPVIVQLMIIYFVILAPTGMDDILIAIIAFGINSAAYVAEIVRSGIMSIDVGQTEAGRSLGLSSMQTMIKIILPQALKNVLPALCNELIVLLKETSVAGYVAITDLTKAGNIIQGRTYEAFLPLIVVAIIYLVIVMVLTSLVNKLERRLSRSDRS